MRTTVLRPGALACALILSACTADQTIAPAVSSSASEHRAPEVVHIDNASELVIVSRTAPLGRHLTASKVIGAAGGTITIPDAGVTLSIPAGALETATQVSITARPGHAVAYDIKPSGLVFAKPVTFAQTLRQTDARPSGIRLSALSRSGSLTASISGTVDELTDTFTASVDRASGYIMSCGRQRAAEEEM